MIESKVNALLSLAFLGACGLAYYYYRESEERSTEIKEIREELDALKETVRLYNEKKEDELVNDFEDVKSDPFADEIPEEKPENIPDAVAAEDTEEPEEPEEKKVFVN